MRYTVNSSTFCPMIYALVSVGRKRKRFPIMTLALAWGGPSPNPSTLKEVQ